MSEMTCKCITLLEAWLMTLGPESLMAGIAIGIVASKLKHYADKRYREQYFDGLP